MLQVTAHLADKAVVLLEQGQGAEAEHAEDRAAKAHQESSAPPPFAGRMHGLIDAVGTAFASKLRSLGRTGNPFAVAISEIGRLHCIPPPRLRTTTARRGGKPGGLIAGSGGGCKVSSD